LHAASLQLVVSSRRQSPSGARHFPQLVVSSLHVAASHPSELAPPAPPIPPLVAGSSPMSSQLSSDGTPASHCSPSSTSPLPQTEHPSVTQPSPSASQVAFPPLNASGSMAVQSFSSTSGVHTKHSVVSQPVHASLHTAVPPTNASASTLAHSADSPTSQIQLVTPPVLAPLPPVAAPPVAAPPVAEPPVVNPPVALPPLEAPPAAGPAPPVAPETGSSVLVAHAPTITNPQPSNERNAKGLIVSFIVRRTLPSRRNETSTVRGRHRCPFPLPFARTASSLRLVSVQRARCGPPSRPAPPLSRLEVSRLADDPDALRPAARPGERDGRSRPLHARNF